MTVVTGVAFTTPGQTQLCRAEEGSGLRLGKLRQGGRGVGISLLVQVMILLSVLVGITHPVFGFNPREVLRTSHSQPYGGWEDVGCMAARGMEESFWGGYTRRRAVCRDDDSVAQQSRDQYDMSCDDHDERRRSSARYVAPVHAGQEWYSVCGVARDGPGWMQAVEFNFAVVLTLTVVSLLVGIESDDDDGSTYSGQYVAHKIYQFATAL